jgi:kynurenine formamidase
MAVDAVTAHEVPFSQVLEALQDQGLDQTAFRQGDILMIRFGYTTQYDNMTDEKRERLNELYKTQKPENVGIKPSKEFLKFLWDEKIAAVCGDSRSFEVWPCKDLDWHLHEWLLAGWGMPIGELFDLEELARICKSLNRYTFFLSSSPMNVSFASNIAAERSNFDWLGSWRCCKPTKCIGIFLRH